VVKQVITDHGYSERRACRLINVDRTAFQYRPRRPDDAGVRERLRELANERRRFGYRRLAVMLKRDGRRMNLKKVYRLYKEERLTVRKRGGRKRALGTRAPMTVGASASSTSSTTSRGSASPAFSIHHCRVCGLCVSSIGFARCTARQR
jgi:transposase InsO family protein